MDVSQQYNTLLPKLVSVLHQITRMVSHGFGDQFVLETSIKKLQSLVRKCDEKECHDITELSDLIRGRLFFPDTYTYNQVLQQLIDLFGSAVRKIEWKKGRDYGLEYRGIVHVDICLNGITFELQVIPLEFSPFIEPQHKIYEILRDGVDIDEKTKKHLIELHNKMFSILEDKYI